MSEPYKCNCYNWMIKHEGDTIEMIEQSAYDDLAMKLRIAEAKIAHLEEAVQNQIKELEADKWEYSPLNGVAKKGDRNEP